MGDWLPAWVWWCVGVGLAVTAQYAVLSQAIELLIRRWSRRVGCPVCGAGPAGGGRRGDGADHVESEGAVSR